MTNDAGQKSYSQSTERQARSSIVYYRSKVIIHRSPVFMRGLSLIEILVAVAVMALLATMFSRTFNNFRDVQTLRVGSSAAASLFERARALSMVDADGKPHGVHIASTTLTLYEGTTYVAGNAANQTVTFLNNLTVVGGTQLSGGGFDVLFAQLTGITAQSGSVVMQVGTDATRQRSILISAQGIVSVQ